MKTNLNDECKNLKNIIENLQNSRIISCGNTSELLKEVNDKYNELWLFQVNYTIDSLANVIGALWRYPNVY